MASSLSVDETSNPRRNNDSNNNNNTSSAAATTTTAAQTNKTTGSNAVVHFASDTTPLLPRDSNHNRNNYNNNVTSTSPQRPSQQQQQYNQQQSILSRLTFHWFTPLLEMGHSQQQLSKDDLNLIPLPRGCQTDPIRQAFEQHWYCDDPSHKKDSNNKELTTKATSTNKNHNNNRTTNENNNKNNNNAARPPSDDGLFVSNTTSSPSLIRTLFNAFGKEYLWAGVLKLVNDLCTFVGPQVLHGMIVYLQTPNAPIYHGLLWTCAVTISQFTMTLCLRHYFFKCYITGLRVRTSIVQIIYDKALRLSSGARAIRTLGEITNLISIDAQRLQELPTYLHALWYSPLQIGLALYFLWNQLGPAALGGVAVILITIPVTRFVAQYMGRQQRSLMQAKDQRVNFNGEVITNMKVIKFQAWEERFFDRILQLRSIELQQLTRYLLALAGTMMIWTFSPLLVALATFTAYVLSGQELDVATALTSLALFAILRFPLLVFPRVVNNAVESLVAVNRIESFLLAEEYQPIQKEKQEQQQNKQGRRRQATAAMAAASVNDKDDDDKAASTEEHNLYDDDDNDDDDKDMIGVEMKNITATYDSKRPPKLLEQQQQTLVRKQGRIVMGRQSLEQEQKLLDKEWQVSLLKAQLQDAEHQIQELLGRISVVKSTTTTTTGGNNDDEMAIDRVVEEEEEQVMDDEEAMTTMTTMNNNNHHMMMDALSLLCLRRVNFRLYPGELVAVVGGVGCGKSSFLNAILGEVKVLSGTTLVTGSLAYFAQTPFIMNATVRDNILFGHVDDDVIDEDLYQRALTSCALIHDIQELFPYGDKTEIGEKG